LIIHFFLLGHSSLSTVGRDSTFVDQHIQAGQDMFAWLQEQLNKLVVGANNGIEETSIEETKEAVMGNGTAHLKRRLSSDSNLLAAMMDNVLF
jgi:predicted transcriptional regulator